MNPQELAQACVDTLYRRDRASRDLGMEIVEVAPGRASVTMTVRENMLNGHELCHGGFIFALADTSFAFACNSHNRNTLAAGARIEYLAPARLGDRLTAVATEISLRGKTGIYDVEVSNQRDERLALFRGNSHRISGPVIEGVQPVANKSEESG